MLQTEYEKRGALLKFAAKNKIDAMNEAAARLWRAGMSWSDAHSIIKDAFDACLQ